MFRLPLLLLLLPSSLAACKCLVALGACNEAVASDLIFIGTVEKMEPAFRDHWNPDRASLLPTEEILRLTQDESPASLARLREIYARLYPNMPEYFKRRFDAAKSVRELSSAMEGMDAEGIQVRIRVNKYFKRRADDDADDDNDADDDGGKVITVWTSGTDCGFPFQTGETYLIYADDDEETNLIETSVCTRTRRLTDAGADLAYLYFRENSEDRATRLEGFVSSDAYQNTSRGDDYVDAPVANVVVELKAGDSARYATTGPDGRYVFDGLASGQYSLTPFDGSFPNQVKALAEPMRFSAGKNSCAREVLVVPKPD